MGKCLPLQDTWFCWCLKKNILHNIIAFDVILVFYIAKLWVLADVIANFYFVVSDVNATFKPKMLFFVTDVMSLW